jgi:hypothetical protein
MKALGIDRHVHVVQKEAIIFNTCQIFAQILNIKERGDLSNMSNSEPCNTENPRNYSILMKYTKHRDLITNSTTTQMHPSHARRVFGGTRFGSRSNYSLSGMNGSVIFLYLSILMPE